MICRSLGGNFTVKVNAAGIVGNTRREISADKQFYMNYIENMGMPPAITSPVATPPTVIASPVTTAARTIMDITPSELPVLLSPAPTPTATPGVMVRARRSDPRVNALVQDIAQLESLIQQITRDYEILRGIYQNATLTNSEFMNSIDVRLRNYRGQIMIEEVKSSNRQFIRR